MRSSLSRRRFLASSVAAAAALVACGEGKRRVASTPTSIPTASVTKVNTRGGILRVYNFDASAQDTFDPHQSRNGPIGNVHSAIFSRLYRYADERAGIIVPDIAEALPEQPDPLTYVVRLRPNVRFHDVLKYRLAYPQVAGRTLTSADVKYSLDRQRNRNSPQAKRYYRYDNWSAIEAIDTPDDRTVVIKLRTPVAPFLAFLAGRHAYILAPETIDQATDEANSDLAMIGSGPFMLDAWEAGVAVRLRRNPAWFARDDGADTTGVGRPFLEGYDAFLSPQEDAFQRMAFGRRLVDITGFSDPAALDNERKTNLADIAVEETDAGGLLASRFLLDRAPYSDDRLRRAIHLAIDRRALAELLFPPMDGRESAKLCGPIAPGAQRWAIAQDDLERRPGYRQQRDEDVAEAKQLWSAASGQTAATELRAFFAGSPRSIPDRAVAAVQRMLGDVLGLTVTPQVDASGQNVIGAALMRNLEGAADGVVQFTFAFEDGGVDLDDWLYSQFRSGAAMNSYRLQDATLDAQLDKQRAEFDDEERRKLGIAVQDYLLANVNARLEYLAPVDRRLAWGYVRNSHRPAWYGSNQDLADTWLDTVHPAWAGRA